MKLAVSIFTLSLVIHNALCTITIQNPQLFSKKGEGREKEAGFLDCTPDMKASMTFEILNDDPLEAIIESVEIKINGTLAAKYDEASNTAEFSSPLDSITNTLTAVVDGNLTTFTLTYNPAKIIMEGKYDILANTATQKEIVVVSLPTVDVQAIVYCTDTDQSLHTDISEEMCKITVKNAGCTQMIYHEPEATNKVEFLDNESRKYKNMKMKHLEEDELTKEFVYGLNETAEDNVLVIDSDTPKVMALNYEFNHGDNKFAESAHINAENTIGCANWLPFCNKKTPTPPALGAPGVTTLDELLTCTLVNHKVVEGQCRSQIVPSTEAPATLTFTCPPENKDGKKCRMLNPASNTVDNKVMNCPVNAREWKPQGSAFAANEWPTCKCGATGLTFSTLFAAVMLFIAKMF